MTSVICPWSCGSGSNHRNLPLHKISEGMAVYLLALLNRKISGSLKKVGGMVVHLLLLPDPHYKQEA